MLEEYIMKKNVKKSSVAKPNKEKSLAQFIRKTKKQTTMLLGKVVINKFASFRTKHYKMGNTKGNRERKHKRVREFARRCRDLSSSLFHPPIQVWKVRNVYQWKL